MSVPTEPNNLVLGIVAALGFIAFFSLLLLDELTGFLRRHWRWGLTLGVLTGSVLNAAGHWSGFAVWLPVNVVLGVLAVWRRDWPQATVWACFTLTAAWGLWRAWA
jgi:hypothetical protein